MVAGLSEVAICNNALIKLNASTIASLADTSKEGKLCNILYPQMRDDVLHQHVWNFALKQASLALLVTAPVWDHDNAFQLPADCLRVTRFKEYEESRLKYKVVGGQLYTDSATATIEYIAQTTDPTKFSPQFTDVLATRLAAEMAYNIAGSASRGQQLMQDYTMKLKDAKRRDGQEGIPRSVQANFWTSARHSNWSFT